MTDLISIAVPIYNTVRFLPEALDSLIAQDHVNWEGLLWDDGSSDGSGEIAADYARRDPRFRVLGNGHQNGIGVALASALKEATGTYVGVLDGDDMLEPNTLSTMLAFMGDYPHLGMAYSQYVEVDEHGSFLATGKRFLKPYSPILLLADFMTYHFRLIRTDAYLAIGGFDPSADVSTDYDLCLRLSEMCEIAHLPQPLYRYRIRGDSISQGSRLRQVRVTFDIAQRALERRGLVDRYSLSLGIRARHVIRSKLQESDT